MKEIQRRTFLGLADKASKDAKRFSMSAQITAFDQNAKLKDFEQKGIISKKQAQLFPQFGVKRPVRSLNRKKVIIPDYFIEKDTPVLLLTCGNRTLAQKLVDSWRGMIKEKHIQIPVYEVVIQEDAIYRFFSPIFEYVLKMSVPKDLRSTIFHHYPQKLSDEEREVINAKYTFLLNAFLIDEDARIRWKSNGMAIDEDAKSLKEAIEQIKSERNDEFQDILPKE